METGLLLTGKMFSRTEKKKKKLDHVEKVILESGIPEKFLKI